MSFTTLLHHKYRKAQNLSFVLAVSLSAHAQTTTTSTTGTGSSGSTPSVPVTQPGVLPPQVMPPLPPQTITLPPQVIPIPAQTIPIPPQNSRPLQKIDPKDTSVSGTDVGAVTILAGMVVRNEICASNYPELQGALASAFDQWVTKHRGLYDAAKASPHYARTEASARNTYAQSGITLSEADCRAQLTRMGA